MKLVRLCERLVFLVACKRHLGPPQCGDFAIWRADVLGASVSGPTRDMFSVLENLMHRRIGIVQRDNAARGGPSVRVDKRGFQGCPLVMADLSTTWTCLRKRRAWRASSAKSTANYPEMENMKDARLHDVIRNQPFEVSAAILGNAFLTIDQPTNHGDRPPDD